jgi:predicted outer membrane repeat protein
MVAFTGPVDARTWSFESETLGSAVQTVADSAADGDTLLFFPGVHEVDLSLTNKGLVLIGQGGAEVVSLTRTGEHIVDKPGLIRIQSTSGKAFRAIGLTFRDGISLGRAQAGGISLSGVSNVWIEACAFVNNRALPSSQVPTNQGGAIQIKGGTSVTIRDCSFEANRTTAGPNFDSSGGAINIVAATIAITGSRFTDNSSEGTSCGGSGGAASIAGSSLTVSDCEFSENSATSGGALLAVGTITMERCRFLGNESHAGGVPCGVPPGSVVSLSGTAIVRESLLLDNGGTGSALLVSPPGHLLIERSTIAFNGEPGNQQPALQLQGFADTKLIFQRNLVAFNHGPGIIHNAVTSSRTACNIIWGNSPDFPGVTDWRGSFNNQASDPLFCSTSEPGITVATNSPSLVGGSGHPEACGVIGVVESACPAVVVARTTWSAIKSRFAGH